jgi:hypothetical protein
VVRPPRPAPVGSPCALSTRSPNAVTLSFSSFYRCSLQSQVAVRFCVSNPVRLQAQIPWQMRSTHTLGADNHSKFEIKSYNPFSTIEYGLFPIVRRVVRF